MYLYFGLCTPFVGVLFLTVGWARLTKFAVLIGYSITIAVSIVMMILLKYFSSWGALSIKQLQHISIGYIVNYAWFKQ